MSKTIAIKSTRLLGQNGLCDACVVVENGKILMIAANDSVPERARVIDVGNSVVMPGLVDSHVHINEPGRSEWEGFETATKAGAAGGITTIADMPLNSQPVTTTKDALDQKLAAAKGKLTVDCAFYGGVIPGNAESLEPLIQAGVRGFKCFLIHSGIDDFPNVGEADLDLAMPILARHNMPLLVHAELECADSQAPDWCDRASSYDAFLHSRPRRWENDAIDLMIKLSARHKCPVHIVHLSSSDALPAIRKARSQGVAITVETCPHYLTFAAEEIKDGDPRFKCAPPIRERENREKLWQAVLDGTIDFVVSDHSPCSPSLKFLSEGNLQKAWGGISGLQFVLPATWTQASQRGATISQFASKVSTQPAKFLGLAGRKGCFDEGADADIVIWNPEAEMKVESSIIEHRHKVTPYDGMKLKGKVEQTYVRGNLVFDNGKFSSKPVGNILMQKRVEIKSNGTQSQL